MKTQFDPFYIEYDNITSPAVDFKTECISAAKKATADTILPLVVMMSGGIDSELVAESLRLANIPFNAVICRLISKDITVNNHDFQYAERWCKKHSVEIIYCDIDIDKQSNLLCQYALSASGFSPQYACHMYIMKWCSDKGFFFLAGNGEMDFIFRDNQYYMLDEQREFTLGNFCRLHNLTGVWQFWKQDARLAAAFLQLPTVKQLMKEKVLRILDYKHKCFADIFEFEARIKQTGFEEIQEWDYILRNTMKNVNGKFDDKYYTPLLKFQ